MGRNLPLLLFGCISIAISATVSRQSALATPSTLPYQQAGLSAEDAAAYLLDRLTFGVQPGDVERVVATGLEAWVERQLSASLPEPVLWSKLTAFPSVHMTAQQQVARYPDIHLVYAHARRFHDLIPPPDTPVDADWRQRKIAQFRKDQGFLDENVDLCNELVGQKIIRARYSQNQLAEVLTDFWFNHFYTTPTDFHARTWILAYERDAIRPHALGNFRDLLAASAMHPAMLAYLDNAQSTAPDPASTSLHLTLNSMRREGGTRRQEVETQIARIRAEIQQVEQEEQIIVDKKFRPRAGINENYARELMELHTLGANGGYTQKDVSEVARAFTGWTVYPIGPSDAWFRSAFAQGAEVGFFRKGHFLFRPDWHDATEKHILGKPFPAGGGMDEGERILDMLAAHPATARHISRKLAVRFVSDTPPQALVEQLATVFQESNGDVRAMMRTLLASPEFWDEAATRSKIKSPFELALSALRALDAEVTGTKEVAEWIARMGQPLYAFQAPTGFPDRASFWINSGTLLARMNFGLSLTLGRIHGVRIDPRLLNHNKEFASATEALYVYLRCLLPGRATEKTAGLVTATVQSPAFMQRVEVPELRPVTVATAAPSDSSMMAAPSGSEMLGGAMTAQSATPNVPAVAAQGITPARVHPLARIAGVIIGSPEFQRR